MHVGVGYSDIPDSYGAGVQAAKMAAGQAGRDGSCDIALLFSTARHDQHALRAAVASVAGDTVPIYGGGAAGVITGDYYGYAGYQVAAALIWLDGVNCDVLIDGGLNGSEEEAGERLGRRLAEIGTTPESPVMMFYDAIDNSDGGFRMIMATWLLQGMQKGLGFLPDLNGAGLIGDHACTPTGQWIGEGVSGQQAIALAFSGDISVDSVIMHGCRPATPYYTVTKTNGPVILEIDGKPALEFMDALLESSIKPEDYPFFLIFGVNHGDRWGEYDEDYYASRLCLGIDKENGGIVMFEPDMVEGTEFQLMYRSFNLEYIKTKIDKAFNKLNGREPVFAIYINCAGRSAGYAGIDVEDAVMVRQTVAGRVPLLGLYTGVEIASIGGQPRGLDWTGVFCLFSQSKRSDAAVHESAAERARTVWDDANAHAAAPNTEMGCEAQKEAPAGVISRYTERNAAKILSLDVGSIAIRYELERKRRGFSLLSELSVSLRHDAGDENIYSLVAGRINTALNMQRTIVLERGAAGMYNASVLQGYSATEKLYLASLSITMPVEFLDHDNPVVVTGADSPERLADVRALFMTPFFISSPVVFQNEVVAILVTGRMDEAPPFHLRLNRSDMETVQSISALLASVLAERRLAAVEERNRIMVDTAPICCSFWNEHGELTDCNQETLSMFGLSSKQEFIENIDQLAPERQPDGKISKFAGRDHVMKAFVNGGYKYDWTYMSKSGELIPAEVTLIRVPIGGDYIVASYVRDLRDQEAARQKIKEANEQAERFIRSKNEFLASVSHEIRTPLNAIQTMARIAQDTAGLDDAKRQIINQGMLSTQQLTSAIEAILDFSKIDAGKILLEIGEFSVSDMVESIAALARTEADKKPIEINVKIDADVPEFLLGDVIRLQQALLNIVLNAVKFTEIGGVVIRVYRDDSNQTNEVLLVFEVSDTGIGISEEQMVDLFKPLYSGDMSYERRKMGMGMGLAVSSSLASLMGGEITCRSNPGEGSVFQLKVPFTIPEVVLDSAQAEPDAGVFDTEFIRGLRVLVAEDNNINQMILEDILASAGAVVTIADNGKEAVDKLGDSAYDLVLMDIQMPVMDGLTATANIRADPAYSDLPILAMTANSSFEHREESIAAGMNDHLTKPVDLEKLYSALKKWGKRV